MNIVYPTEWTDWVKFYIDVKGEREKIRSIIGEHDFLKKIQKNAILNAIGTFDVFIYWNSKFVGVFELDYKKNNQEKIKLIRDLYGDDAEEVEGPADGDSVIEDFYEYQGSLETRSY